MERTQRTRISAALGLAAATFGLGLAAPIAHAQTTPPTLQILDVRLGQPAVVGREATIVADAVDPKAPVSGMVVRFGARTDVFGISACRLPDSEGRVPKQFLPGARTRLTVPHRFRKRGMRKLLVRVDSGGCLGPFASLYQPVTVTPTPPQDPPKPLIPGLTSIIEPLGSLLPPIMPASPVAPPVPGLPQLPANGARKKRRGCPGSGKRLARSPASVRRTRRALLCLLNKIRRRSHLKRLRGNPRLLRAAEHHSASMVRRHFFSHVEPGGISPLDRILRTGYLSGARAYTYGENIGFGTGPTSSARSMMRAWMHSTPHRANILTRQFREVGLGIAQGIPGRRRAHGGTYTTVFGVRR